MDKIDLHVHTTASDGTMCPRDVVSLAAMLGLKAIAITDHDTMAGLQEAGEAGELLGVTIVPGIELSTDYQGKDVHVLGYFLDDKAPALQEYIAWVRTARQTRNEKILEKLRHKGYDISLTQLEETYPNAVLGRPHIAQELQKLGAVQNVSEAFRRYLGQGRSCYVERERIPFQDAAKLIRKCGGVAVLAHPLQYGFDKKSLETLVQAASKAGFSGMEVYYTGYTQGDMQKLFDLAEKYTLLPTGGSDFHGDTKPGVQLGSGDGKLAVPAYFLIMLARSQYPGM
jgi:predicted metal-dependent phosphoesterase TrpH